LRDALKSSILPNMFGTNMKFSKNLAWEIKYNDW
jgi:hypothetical protein